MKTFALATAAIGLAAASTAFAGTETAQTVQVSLAGLDLDTPEGQRLLDQRIDRAARAVCDRDEAVTGTRLKSSAGQACYEKARANAKRQVTIVMAGRQRGG
jgi:UrcA family protein